MFKNRLFVNENENNFVSSFFSVKLLFCSGSRHQTPDTMDERVHDLPPRNYSGPRNRVRRDNHHRRDDRRRTTDDEDTVLDSQDVSSVDRGKFKLNSNII